MIEGYPEDRHLNEIGWKDELHRIKNLANDKNQCMLKLHKGVATKESLLGTLKKGVKLLHIACHGFSENESTRPKQLYQKPQMSVLPNPEDVML